ncbi:MAG: sensor domain-containing protein [Actinomycetota bacterium]
MDARLDPAPQERTIGQVARWWFGPMSAREPWVATGYLLASAFVAVGWFAVAAVVVALAIPLTILVAGIPVVVGLLAALVKLGSFDRRRAGWLGADIQAPEMVAGRSWVAWRDRFGDPVRWRALAYFASAVFVFWILFALAVVGWAGSLYLVTFPIWGWAIGAGPLGMVVSVLAGVVLAGVGPRAALLFGRLGVSYTRSLLGRDEVAVMQERVDQLSANRDEILSAVATERRRIERNLHDGVQQHLVAMGIDLGLAANKIESDPAAAAELLRSATEKNRASIGELRTIGRGLHPAVLDDRGLDAALSAVVAGSPVPIELSVEAGLELPIETAETAYFVVSEAIANMLKHAKARTGSVRIHDEDQVLHIRVHDDGRGGADPDGGTGLAGIAARVRGADGTFAVTSPKGGPTVIDVRIPHG